MVFTNLIFTCFGMNLFKSKMFPNDFISFTGNVRVCLSQVASLTETADKDESSYFNFGSIFAALITLVIPSTQRSSNILPNNFAVFFASQIPECCRPSKSRPVSCRAPFRPFGLRPQNFWYVHFCGKFKLDKMQKESSRGGLVGL